MKSELETMITERLGQNYDRKRLAAVRAEFQAFDRAKRILDKAVRSGGIDGRTFATRANKLAEQYFGRVEDILGRADYERVFGRAGSSPIMDPEVAAHASYHR